MDTDTIQKFATEVAKRVPQYPLYGFLLQALLFMIAGAIGAYVGSYLKAKGNNLATREDFEGLKTQLRENTALVENIKSEIAQKDWVTREWQNLRRIKLEELFTKMHDAERYPFILRYEQPATLQLRDN